MEQHDPLKDLWPAIAIAAVVTVSILITVLWMQRQEMKLAKQELMDTKMELLEALSKKIDLKSATSTVVKASNTPSKTIDEKAPSAQLEVWNGDWTVRNTDYQIAKPHYRLECVGQEANRVIKRTQLVKMNADGTSSVLVEDVAKAGMEADCDSVIWVLEPKGISKAYFVNYDPPSVGPVYAFDPATEKFSQAERWFFGGRRLDYVFSPDQRYVAQIGGTEDVIVVYDVVMDRVEEIGKLKAGESYAKSLWLFNSMASGEPVASLSWTADGNLKANVYSSKVPLKEEGTCGVKENPDYKCFERKPIRSVELTP